MKAAVLMSSYNGEKYIREQIDSILNQEGSFQLELWVRDDGSTDGTKDILKQYEKEKKLRWYTGDNLKPAYSFLDLICHCPGYDFYAFADQDDDWMPDKLQVGIEKIAELDEPALYCANAELVDDTLQFLGRNVYKQTPKTDIYTLACAGGLLGCTMIFNRKLAELIQNHEQPKQLMMHDFYLALICASVRGVIKYDDSVHMKYRQHEKNVVGVSHGIWGAVKSRWNDITTKPQVGIDRQAAEAVRIYRQDIGRNESDWLIKVSKYRDSFWNRLGLACSLKTIYINRNMSVKLRLSILFGNR